MSARSGFTKARDHFGTDETVPPAAESLDAYTRSKVEAEELALQFVTGARACRWRSSARASSTVRATGPCLPKLLHSLRTGRFAYFGSGDQALNCIYVKNLVHGIFLAAEVPEAIGEVFNLTDGGRVSKRKFIGRVAELAGLKPPRRKIPLWLAWTLAVLLERRARRLKSPEPPLVNKARYKFLGLNLDYSIAKAQRVLGYNPPLHHRAGLVESMAELRPRAPPRRLSPVAAGSGV